MPARAGGRPPPAALPVLGLLAVLAAPVPLRGVQDGPDAGNGRIAGVLNPETAPRPTARVAPAAGPIVVDGVLDEPAWRAAEVITGFVQAIPDAGHPATEETEVRILHDASFLYIGALLHDSEPDALVVKTLERDHPGVSAHDMDVFAVFIDTFLDRRNGFIFIVNPAGAVRDGQTFDDSRNLDFAWDAVVHVATRVHADGWTVEMAIPWTSLRFDPHRDRQVWGMNFHRSVKRRNERSHWAPLDRREQIHRASRAGTVVGPDRIPRVRNLRLKPFALARHAREPVGGPGAGASGEAGADAGLDLKHSVTPNLTLDLSYRTDFSHVEVDHEEVNLTRFPLFFPERRDFFVENSGTFQLGDQSERNYRAGTSLRDLTLFHSRRIGLHEGRPVPMTGGARLTGHAGGFELGVLAARTARTDALPAETFSVLRIRRGLPGNADVGLMVTDRRSGLFSGTPARDPTGGEDVEAREAGYDRAFGLDGSFRPLPNMIVHSYLAATRSSRDEDGDRRAGRVWIGWRDALWDASALVRYVGDGFDPGVGFVRRSGIRHGYVTLGMHPRPPLPGVLDVNPYVEVHHIENLGGVLETRSAGGGLGVGFRDGGTLELEATDRFERLEQPFRVQAGAVVPAGDHRFREYSARYQSSRHRAFSAGVRAAGGGYFSGRRTSLGANAAWQPSPQLALEVSAARNDLRLEGASFPADLYAARLKYARSTRLYSSTFFQYNGATGHAVSNVRLTFIHAPLSELHLVLAERRDVRGPEPVERRITAKLTRLLQF